MLRHSHEAPFPLPDSIADYGIAHDLGNLVVTEAATEAYGLIPNPVSPLLRGEGQGVLELLDRLPSLPTAPTPQVDIVMIAPQEAPELPGVPSVEDVAIGRPGFYTRQHPQGVHTVVWLSSPRSEIVDELVRQRVESWQEKTGNPTISEEDIVWEAGAIPLREMVASIEAPQTIVQKLASVSEFGARDALIAWQRHRENQRALRKASIGMAAVAGAIGVLEIEDSFFLHQPTFTAGVLTALAAGGVVLGRRFLGQYLHDATERERKFDQLATESAESVAADLHTLYSGF